MNIFNKIVADENANDTKLGLPSTDEGHFQRRMDIMKAIRNGAGFRQNPKKPKKDAQGMTRGDRKRAARDLANSKVSEYREPQFRHGLSRHLVELRAAA